MKLKSLLVILFICLFLTINGLAQTVKPKIAAIRAQLFYEAKGTFSGDILSQEGISLWNTIIGEGSAGGASTSTLVTVEVSGKNVPLDSTKIEITATNSKNKLIVRKIFDVAIYDERTKFYAPVWLYDTGCDPIKLSARLIGKGANQTIVKKTIPFACGE